MMPALLKPAEKRVFDLLHDWPWNSQGELAGIMGLSQPRATQLISGLNSYGLITPSGSRASRYF